VSKALKLLFHALKFSAWLVNFVGKRESDEHLTNMANMMKLISLYHGHHNHTVFTRNKPVVGEIFQWIVSGENKKYPTA